MDAAGKGRDNIPPDKVPWNALRTLFSQAVYGGRIDNDFDQRLLNTFLERIFTVARLEYDFFARFLHIMVLFNFVYTLL